MGAVAYFWSESPKHLMHIHWFLKNEFGAGKLHCSWKKPTQNSAHNVHEIFFLQLQNFVSMEFVSIANAKRSEPVANFQHYPW